MPFPLASLCGRSPRFSAKRGKVRGAVVGEAGGTKAAEQKQKEPSRARASQARSRCRSRSTRKGCAGLLPGLVAGNHLFRSPFASHRAHPSKLDISAKDNANAAPFISRPQAFLLRGREICSPFLFQRNLSK